MKDINTSEYSRGFIDGYTKVLEEIVPIINMSMRNIIKVPINQNKNIISKDKEEKLEMITMDKFQSMNCKFCGSFMCPQDKEAISTCYKYKGNIDGIEKREGIAQYIKKN